MLGNLTGMHLLIMLGIIVLLFGATKLPALAKGLGQSFSIFKKEIGRGEDKPEVDSSIMSDAANPAPKE